MPGQLTRLALCCHCVLGAYSLAGKNVLACPELYHKLAIHSHFVVSCGKKTVNGLLYDIISLQNKINVGKSSQMKQLAYNI
jgi:hypothetical protein